MKRSKFLCSIAILIYCNIVTAQQVLDNRLSTVTCIPVDVDQAYTFLLDTVGIWTRNCPFVYGGGEEKVLP